MKRNFEILINDILENIENIESFSKGMSIKELSQNKLKLYAITRALEIIGEATKGISDDFRKKHPEIPWKNIAGLRDIITHAYFGVNTNRIWEIIKDDLPKLKQNMEKIKKDLK